MAPNCRHEAIGGSNFPEGLPQGHLRVCPSEDGARRSVVILDRESRLRPCSHSAHEVGDVEPTAGEVVGSRLGSAPELAHGDDGDGGVELARPSLDLVERDPPRLWCVARTPLGRSPHIEEHRAVLNSRSSIVGGELFDRVE